MQDELGQTRRVLLVDPDPRTRDRVAPLLKAEGFDVIAATSVDQAIEELAHQSVGVAVLDVQIGPDSGLELLEWLVRESSPTRALFYTHEPTLRSAMEAVNLGAYAYLEKGEDTGELVRAVHGAFRTQARPPARSLVELVEERTRSLHESQQRFRDFVETMSDWVWETDALGRYTFVSPQITDLLGFEPEELIGRFVLDIVAQEDRPSADRAISVVRRTQPRFRVVEIPIECRDGRIAVHELRWVPVLDADGSIRCFRGTGRDVTERRRLEEQLRRSQKLDAVGRLAGGIAHDFNNLLTIVIANSELMMAETLPPAEVRAFAESTLEAALRGSSLTNQLLAFARQRPLEAKPFDLASTVNGLAEMLRRLIGEHIVLELIVPDRELFMKGNPGQIEQILVNLSINARDAMPEGGRITVEVFEAPSDIVLMSSEAGDVVDPLDCIGLRVTDEGRGIAPEHLDKIFEPFFSTKGPDGGVGLGLASVYGIVRQSEGDIRVESEPGRGTTFFMYFPLVDAPTESDRIVRRVPRRARPHERILLVEDEPGVRRLEEQILVTHGYHVDAFASPRDALAHALEDPLAFDLLVTDRVMPELMGEELAERIRARRPDLRVLFVSGNGGQQAVDARPVRGSELQKPFTVSELTDAVRAALDCTLDIEHAPD